MPPDPATAVFPAMGGSVELQLVGADEAAPARVQSLFSEYESVLSRFLPDSELCALNRSAGAPFRASPLLLDAVEEALRWARATDGIFDPTMLEALVAIGYDRTFDEVRALPGGTRSVATAVRGPAWRQVRVDNIAGAITLPAGVSIDLGGIGKGFTVDRAIAMLGPGANAMVNAAGDLFAAGPGPDGEGWLVGVQDPFAPDVDCALLRLQDRGVATSGAVNRWWQIGGVRYHHLIDPAAGTSARSDLLTVTVIAPSATEADAMAKTAFILGAEAGLSLIERRPHCEAIAMKAEGGLLATAGARSYME